MQLGQWQILYLYLFILRLIFTKNLLRRKDKGHSMEQRTSLNMSEKAIACVEK